MTPPIAYKTVTGRYTAPSGAPVAGVVRFVPLVTVLDPADGEVVPPIPVTVTLDAAGYFAADLMCTDAAGTSPTGWLWSLDELFAGGRRGWTFALPSSGGGVVDLADVLPADPVDVTYAYASAASMAAMDARVTAVEAASAVTIAAVVIHPMLVMGA